MHPPASHPIFAISLIDGQITEATWADGKVECIRYPAPMSTGTEDVRLKTEKTIPLGCLFGNLLSTWLGPQSQRAEFFQTALTSSEYGGSVNLEGVLCDKFVWDRGKEPDGYERQDVFFVDRKMLLLRRWDTLETGGDGERRLTRSRLYENIRTLEVVPKDILWSLDGKCNSMIDKGRG